MAEQGEWKVCGLPTTQSALPQIMSPVIGTSKPLIVPVMQTMASLLSAILDQTVDLKNLYANRVLHFWPPHYQQFSSFVNEESYSVR